MIEYFRQSEVCVHRGAAFLGVGLVHIYSTEQGGEMGLARRVGAQPRCCVQFLLCTCVQHLTERTEEGRGQCWLLIVSVIS